MCGIAGYSTLHNAKKVNPALIDPMIASLTHRGPDDQGRAFFPQVALGHRRLSIIGLDDGQQPLANEDGTVVVVFNGEIYNYPQLRKELEAQGHTFRTRTDTEVLVHLYEEQGIDFVGRLNGMFAFALYDTKKNELFLARDRFGVKPLVYGQFNDAFYFASEIKALKTVPGFDAQVDWEAVGVYLGLFYIPDPWTAYQKVRKLRPGHFLRISRAGIEDREYFDLDFSRKNAIKQSEAEEQTVSLFRQSVERQLLSDVPVGVLLSGGMDSSSILAAASERISQTKSFTITFSEKEYNEGSVAAQWARAFDSPHQTFCFTEDDFCDRFLERQRHLDEPFALWCNVAMEGMAEFIHQQQYKVVLSGEGGDEVFCGYPTLNAAYFARYYRYLPSVVRKKVITPLVMNLPARSQQLPLSFMLKSFVRADHPDPKRNFFGFKEVVRQELWPLLLSDQGMNKVRGVDPARAFSQYYPKVRDWPLIDALSYLDFKVQLPGCLFFDKDNAFMSNSVELRVPFMDNDLVDFATRLPTNMRFHPIHLKRLLRQGFSRYLSRQGVPQGVLRHYRKRGFEVPGNIWIAHQRFSALLKSVLCQERIEQVGFFRYAEVKRMIDEQIALKENNERILQAIMSLNLFLERKEL